jgi:hypothetical protein
LGFQIDGTSGSKPENNGEKCQKEITARALKPDERTVTFMRKLKNSNLRDIRR